MYYYPSFYLLIIISMHVKDRQGVSGRCAALDTSIHNYGGHNNNVHIMKGYIFLYLMIYLYLRKTGNYGNHEFIIDFFTFMF